MGLQNLVHHIALLWTPRYVCTYVLGVVAWCRDELLPKSLSTLHHLQYRFHTVYAEILQTFLIWQFGSQDPNRQILSSNSHRPVLTMLCPCCAMPSLISANVKLQPDLAQITKFSGCQCFRIYGMLCIPT